MTAAVQLEGLTRTYGATVAVDGVDLEIGVGEIYGLVGPNGAGKSTTLRMLATLLEPSAGEARVLGVDVGRRPNSVRRIIGYMPDTFGVYDDMRVSEYLDFFAQVHVIPAQRRRQMVGDLLELVDLAAKRDAYVHSLSRGMQQRLCLAHALVHDPPVLLLDEPASGLDPRARAELRELLRELRAMGKTIVISSHILPELEELCSAVAIMDQGKLLAAGPVAEIEARFRRGSVIRTRVIGDAQALAAALDWFRGSAHVASAAQLSDGLLELALPGGDDAVSTAMFEAMKAGHRLASFAPVASDLEELFLQITAPEGPAGA